MVHEKITTAVRKPLAEGGVMSNTDPVDASTVLEVKETREKPDAQSVASPGAWVERE
jgi:hypothetical protein